MNDPAKAGMEPSELAIFKLALQGLPKAWDAVKGTKLVSQHFPPTPEEFLELRKLQKAERRLFSDAAFLLPRYADARSAYQHSPLLASPSWALAAPVLLHPPQDNLEDDQKQLVTTFMSINRDAFLSGPQQSADVSRRVQRLIPKPFTKLSDAIRAIEKPDAALFQSRPSYALSKLEVSDDGFVRSEFKKAHYFDYIDAGELLALEVVREMRAMHAVEEGAIKYPDPTGSLIGALLEKLDARLALRSLLGNWKSLALRPSLTGINVLTIFLDTETGAATFPMMRRSIQTGSAAGTVHVIPAGEFQPTVEDLGAWPDHCTLWQTVLRESAEELLNHPESESHDKHDMRDLAASEPIASMLGLIRAGSWKTYFLGAGLDALTLKPEFLLVSVINQRRFSEALGPFLVDGKLPRAGSEGNMENRFGWGNALTTPMLRKYRDDEKALPAASGCIELFMRSAPVILGRDLTD